MSKPSSKDDLAAQLTSDRNWRIKEISDLKSAILAGDRGLQKVLLRALVTICYAHWEGYVRFAAHKYLTHIALRKIQYQKLHPQFLKNYFLPRLSATHNRKLSVSERCALVEDILNSSEKRFGRVNNDLINTKSNLNFDVFSDICIVCGISISKFEASARFIDVMLLARRNSIAHGEDTFVAIADLEQLVVETLALIRGFGDALENSAVLEEYALTASSRSARGDRVAVDASASQ
jgi:hypothetical protein